MQLLVRNVTAERRVRDELVCHVDVLSSSLASRVAGASAVQQQQQKLVVETYSREDVPVRVKSGVEAQLAEGKMITVVHGYVVGALVCSRSDEEKKLAGFLKYLVDRNKVGVVGLADTCKAFVFSATLRDGVSALYLAAPEANDSQVQQSAPLRASAASAAPLAPSVTTSAAAACVAAPRPALTGFLGSVMSQMNASAKVLAKAKASAPKEVVNAYEALETDVRDRVREFQSNSDATFLELSPMAKDQRAVVHDLVAEFDDLVSNSAGDDLDRHVVIYRRGHEPQGFMSNGEERALLKASRAGGTRKAQNKSKSANEDHGQPVDAIRVDPIRDASKRNRVTIEEVEEMLRQKRARATIGEEEA